MARERTAASGDYLARSVSDSQGGELAKLVKEHDWSETPVGPIETWPQSLRTVVNILLTSRYPMWMGWGNDLTFLYNDAYRPTLGIKHPWALGSPASKVWAEIWRDIMPRIESVLSAGQATYDQGLLLFLERSGFPEETYHTFSYSPLHDDRGQLNGMLCVVTEETDRVISERRMTTLRLLSGALASSNSEAEVLAALQQQLGQNPYDLPFTVTYLFDREGRARLACSTGASNNGQVVAPPFIEAGDDFPWPATEIFGGVRTRLIKALDDRDRFPALPSGAWDKAPNEALVVPITQAQETPAGFLAVGVNPFRRLDPEYSGFVELIAGQVAAALANARAYEEERRRAEELAKVDRAKTLFFSNVSHEFRTPLTLMLGPVEELISKPDGSVPHEDREALNLVYRNGRRLQRLVNTLLDFSRIEAGRAQASYAPTELATLTTGFASPFRSAMERAGLQYIVDCKPLPGPMYVDQEMWEKIVLNLISNAFKYTLNGSVVVSLRDASGSAEFSVRDTGIGIPAAELPRVFERFHRVEGTGGRTHEGTGIGLALVRELVQLHGGSVSVESEAGRGSSFTVLIPFGSAHLPPDRIQSGQPPSSAGSHADAYVEEALRWLPEGGNTASQHSANASSLATDERENRVGTSRVLVADDNADMREYVTRLLAPRYEVVSTRTGDEAFALAMADPPDLVLTDVMMPGLDGFSLLRELRAHERTKTLPIILLSARAGEESRIEGLDAGADDYIAKPFTARELSARVDAHLSLARMRREADKARRLSEARLGLALNAPGILSWEWNPKQDELSTIGDLQHIFVSELRTIEDALRFIHPEDAPEHRAKLERVAKEGGSYHSEYRVRQAHRGGATAWLEERAVGILDENGCVHRVLGVVVDVTEHKMAQEELRRKNEELTKANQELEEFAYVASHDLQEPLRMVNIYSQLLLRRDGLRNDTAAGQYAEFVQKGVLRMEELINDLLVYSRVIHSDHDEAHMASLDRCLSEAISVLHGRIEETGAQMVSGPLTQVIGDEKQLTLVFQNLLSNALKYRRDDVKPRVEIWTESRGGECVVNVRDNGIGFSPEYAERIFGLFKRLHKDAYPGTGLGLAICRRIIERYGGKIWGTSEGEGLGATFAFSLSEPNI
ncbi:MAG: ATP-binding protein [Bryobacteraceae bacterium]